MIGNNSTDMMQDLKVALIQTEIIWHNAEKNLMRYSQKIEAISEEIDLLILPEMFTTGFSMEPFDIAESMTGRTLNWMQEIASKKNTAVCGSIIVKENENYFNRLLFVHPTGQFDYYDKKHLFTLAGEHHKYTAGNKRLIVSYKGWKICPLVCYDLRFPVWSRNTEAYDLLLFVANWPAPRIGAWDTLLKARAIENMSYCIGVNRVGTDANNLNYSGHSSGFDYFGEPIASLAKNEEGIALVSLDKNELLKVREKLNFLKDRDAFELS
jgi:predicted amidohydrolase